MSNSPYCVGWQKYLNCSFAITRCWQTGIHLLVFLYTWLRYLRSWVESWSNIWNSVFIHCKCHTNWTDKTGILTIGGTYTPFCIRMASLFFKVRFKAQDHTLNIVVVCRKDTVWIFLLGLPNLIHTLIFNQERSLFFCQGRITKLKGHCPNKILSEHECYTL